MDKRVTIPQLLQEETPEEAAGGVRGWWERLGAAPKEVPHSAPYLRLGPHERESHAAFEEVRFQQFTGNAHFLLKERKTPTDGLAAQDRCGHGPREADGDFGRHGPSLVPRQQPLWAVGG